MLAVVVDAATTRALEQVVGQQLVPQVLDLLRLREEAVAADVEVVALVLAVRLMPPTYFGSASITVVGTPALVSR